MYKASELFKFLLFEQNQWNHIFHHNDVIFNYFGENILLQLIQEYRKVIEPDVIV